MEKGENTEKEMEYVNRDIKKSEERIKRNFKSEKKKATHQNCDRRKECLCWVLPHGHLTRIPCKRVVELPMKYHEVI